MMKILSIAMAALFFTSPVFAGDSSASQTPAEKLGWKLAMHSYTLNRYSIDGMRKG